MMSPLSLHWPITDVQTQLRAIHPDFQLEILRETDSTNTQLLTRLRQGHITPTLLVAENQTAGKGRMGKQWLAQTGYSLTFSFLMPTVLESIGWLALVSACAVIQTLEKQNFWHQDSEIKIKWPNDIWIKPNANAPWHKLVGILIETASIEQQRYAIVGIGINICSQSTPTHPQIPQGSLEQLGSNWDVPTAFSYIAPELVQAVYNFRKEDIPYWRDLFHHYDLLLHQPLRTSSGINGIGLGINSQGQFLIKTPENIQTIHSGEVSIRPCLNI